MSNCRRRNLIMLKRALILLCISFNFLTMDGCYWNDPTKERVSEVGAPIYWRLRNNAFGYGAMNVRVNDRYIVGVREGQIYPSYAFNAKDYESSNYEAGRMRVILEGAVNQAPVEKQFIVSPGTIYNIDISLFITILGNYTRVAVSREPSYGVNIRFWNNLPVFYWDNQGQTRASNNPQQYLQFGLQPVGASVLDLYYLASVPYGQMTTYYRLNLYDFCTDILYFLDPFVWFQNEAIQTYSWRTTILCDTKNLLAPGAPVDLRSLQPGGYYTIETHICDYNSMLSNTSSNLPVVISREG
jgi:hypothetical protein